MGRYAPEYLTSANTWAKNSGGLSSEELDGMFIVSRIDKSDRTPSTTAFFLHLPNRIFAKMTLMSTITLERRWNDSARQSLSPAGYDYE